MNAKPEFAVNQFTTMPQSFEQDLEAYQSAGVRHVEVCEIKLSKDAGEARRQLESFKERGFTITSVQPRVHALYPDRMASEPEAPEDRMERFRETIDLFTDVFPGLDVPFVAIGGGVPKGDFRRAHADARRLLPELADYAAGRGVSIAFEIIHPILMNLDTFICTLKEGIRLVEDVDRPNFGLVVDAWHLWDEVDVCERIAALGDRAFLLHLADWPSGGPRRMDDRLIPGDGTIDLPAIAEATRRAGYDGPCIIELLSDTDLPDSLWKTDPAKVIERSRDALRRMDLIDEA